MATHRQSQGHPFPSFGVRVEGERGGEAHSASLWAAGPECGPLTSGSFCGLLRAQQYATWQFEKTSRGGLPGPKPQPSNQSRQAVGRPPGALLPQACPSTLMSGLFEMKKKKVVITSLGFFSMTWSPVHLSLSHGRWQEGRERSPGLVVTHSFGGQLRPVLCGDWAYLPLCKKLLLPWCVAPSLPLPSTQCGQHCHHPHPQKSSGS